MLAVKATTITDAFHQLLFKFFEKDPNTGEYINAYETEIDAGSFGKDKLGDETEGAQKRLQVPLVSIEIQYPHSRPLAVTFPEVCGIPPVATDEAIEEYFSHYLMNAELTKNEEYTYGSRMLDFPCMKKVNYNYYVQDTFYKKSFNQIDWVINHFKEAPANNHCCVEIGKGDDFLLKSAPCLRLISFKIVEGKLNITVFLRSWDFWVGFPINLGGLQLLNEYVASEIGIETGTMYAVSDGLHIYSHNIPFALERLGR